MNGGLRDNRQCHASFLTVSVLSNLSAPIPCELGEITCNLVKGISNIKIIITIEVFKDIGLQF